MSDTAPLTGIYRLPALYELLCAGFGGEDLFVNAARRTGGPVLELGSGSGRIIGAIAKVGFAATGLDLVPEMVRYAAARHPDVRFLEGEMTRFALAGASG